MFVSFSMQLRIFCSETYFSKSLKNLAKFLKSVQLFRKFFSVMVFAAETSRKCKSVTYNFCSFRPKRAFPRPWAARWIKEKFFLISFCTFIFMFCCFQKVYRCEKVIEILFGWFFSQRFTCPGKFSAKLIPSFYRPPFATSHKITQKYIFSNWISRETEFSAANVDF